MKLGLQLGYWGAHPPTNHADLVTAAEEAGFDAIPAPPTFTFASAASSSPLSWIAVAARLSSSCSARLAPMITASVSPTLTPLYQRARPIRLF